MMKILIIFFLAVICFIEPLDGYSHCYDDNNKGMYYGTIAVTTSGKHCQPWADQSPWSHTYTNDANFPFDGGVAGANNYCRDPDFNYVPWCYTMDPTERWGVCDIPKCTSAYGISNGAYGKSFDEVGHEGYLFYKKK